MSSEEKERILRAVEEDRGFRYALMGLLGFKEVLDRFARLEEHQQKLEERFAKLEEKFVQLEERMGSIEEEMNRLSRIVITIAHRFGVITEEVFEPLLVGYCPSILVHQRLSRVYLMGS